MPTLLPTIPPTEIYILELLFDARFITSNQLQVLLNHKDKHRISVWLRDLRTKNYVSWHYDGIDYAAKTKPAVYFLNRNGIRLLREQTRFPLSEINKRRQDKTRSTAFIEQRLLLVDSLIALQTNPDKGVNYTASLRTDKGPEGLKAQLAFTKHEAIQATEYLLEIVSYVLPRPQLKKRLRDYVSYLENTSPQAVIVLFALSDVSTLIYVKRYLQNYLEERGLEDELQFRVTTKDLLASKSVLGDIWEVV